MSSLLSSLDLGRLESLKEFSLRFPDLPTTLDKDFEKIWICHKTDCDAISETIDLKNVKDDEDHSHSPGDFVNRFNASNYCTEFDVKVFCDKIYEHFKNPIASYILNNCYLFCNWGMNSFEILVDHHEVHMKILEKQYRLKLYARSHLKKHCDPHNILNKKIINKCEPSGTMSSQKYPQAKKGISWKKYCTALQSCRPFLNTVKSASNPMNEEFNLNSLLYDPKLRTQWSKSHVLSMNDEDKLLAFIINNSKLNINMHTKMVKECQNWTEYKKVLRYFLERHTTIEKCNGYGRILKKHLKNGVGKSKNLTAIKTSIVSSYIIDILRKVLPQTFYFNNHIKKKLFSSIVKIITGRLGEQFIWSPYIQILINNSSKLTWCMQINEVETRNFIIFKTFKFIIEDYVFVILKNNFYITETGSSGFGLRFYWKPDMDRATSECLNDLLYLRQVRLFKRHEFDCPSMERKWVDTGVVHDFDIYRKAHEFMYSGTEFKQPVAYVRFLPKKDTGDEMRIITKINSKTNKKLQESMSDRSKELIKTFEGRFIKRKTKLLYVKLFLQFLIDKIGVGIKPVPNNGKLEVAWMKAVSMKRKWGKLYFVKTDIADAFDSILHEKLVEVLEKSCQDHCDGSLQLLRVEEWQLVNSKIEESSRFSFSSRPRENAVLKNRTDLINGKRLPAYQVSEFISIIKQVALQQRLVINDRIFKLTKGLCQGSAGKFSPQLCEVYLSFMDKLYFKKCMESDLCVFLRGVDDYLMITPVKKAAEWFLKIVRGGIREFNVMFNTHKLKSNVLEEENVQVDYLGLTFNFADMSVRPDYSKYARKSMLCTMKLSDAGGRIHFDKNLFFERRLLCMSTLKLQPILLKSNYNDEKTLREVVFQACLVQSMRAMSLANYLYPNVNQNDLIIRGILCRTCKKLMRFTRLRNCLAVYEINWLFLKAVEAIFKTRSGQFKALLVMIRYDLQRLERKIPCDQKTFLDDFMKDLMERRKMKCLINSMVKSERKMVTFAPDVKMIK